MPEFFIAIKNRGEEFVRKKGLSNSHRLFVFFEEIKGLRWILYLGISIVLGTQISRNVESAFIARWSQTEGPSPESIAFLAKSVKMIPMSDSDFRHRIVRSIDGDPSIANTAWLHTMPCILVRSAYDKSGFAVPEIFSENLDKKMLRKLRDSSRWRGPFLGWRGYSELIGEIDRACRQISVQNKVRSYSESHDLREIIY